MKFTGKFVSLAHLALLMGLMTIGAFAQGHGGPGGGNSTRDPLAGLKRAITQASAPALTATQETALTALITAYQDALPDGEDTALETAKDAFDAAVLAGNQTAADTAAGQIAARQAELNVARLRALSRFEVAVLANLRTGGQLTLLVEKFTAERVLNMVASLAGHGGRGR